MSAPATRYLLLSDLHSNREALRAVLARAAGLGCSATILLGDVVGYGPEPNEVIEDVAALPDLVAVRGNHDRVAVGSDGGGDFNSAARAAALWTRAALSERSLRFLRDLPRGPRALRDGVLISHGSPLDEDQYLLDAESARRSLEGRPFDLCFYGHTHLPGAFVGDGRGVGFEPASGDGVVLALRPAIRYLVNPGSVGQPRDRDPRAAFAVYDADGRRVTFHRVAYDHAETRAKIARAGLPPWLGERLGLGA